MIEVEARATWLDRNQRALMNEVACVRASLERYAGHEAGPAPARVDPSTESALDMVCARLGLSSFERQLLVMCAAPELDGRFARTLAQAQGDPARVFPTFGLALAALDDPHWSALTPGRPLRHWRLIEVGAGSLTNAPLMLDEWLLHVLTGAIGLDTRLAPLLRPLTTAEIPRSDTTWAPVEELLSVWTAPRPVGGYPPVQLCGSSTSAKSDAVTAACARLGWSAFTIKSGDLPTNAVECDQLLRLWEREAAIRLGLLVINAQDAGEPSSGAGLVHLVDGLSMPVAVMTRSQSRVCQRPTVAIAVPGPTRSQRRAMWIAALGEDAALFDGRLDAVAAEFEFDATAIVAAATDVRRGRPLWDACRRATRTTLDELAQRIDPVATFDDLVVSSTQRDLLDDITAHVRQRVRVFDEWGMGGPSARGLGTSALFAGPSGTGKTLAAEVVAQTLALDLYHIDLSQVVSKYIGETEKNLRRVFDAAEEGGAVLLFDEADALFGKRSEVRDSHDRYANIEISYLLQRMETYRGLAILTTNMRSAIDLAFMRRLRFVVEFPFPDLAQREQLWRRAFSPATPTFDLDFSRLARLAVAGGNIRNIALHAAFLAADADEPVGMHLLLRAAIAECVKLERPPTDSEIGGWA